MQVSRCVYSTEKNGQAIKDQICLWLEFDARANWIRPATGVGDKPGYQSLWRNFYALSVFLRCFGDLIRVPRIENWVPRIRENYHRVLRIRENRVPRIRQAGSLQIHTGCLIFSLKKTGIILDSQKYIMLIYVSCETPEQITNYLYFKLRSFVPAWFNLFAIVVFVEHGLYSLRAKNGYLDIRERIDQPPFP